MTTIMINPTNTTLTHLPVCTSGVPTSHVVWSHSSYNVYGTWLCSTK